MSCWASWAWCSKACEEEDAEEDEGEGESTKEERMRRWRGVRGEERMGRGGSSRRRER